MKRGIVMEKRRRYMIVMTRNGIFQKAAPMNESAIGEEVYFKPVVSKKWLSFFFYPKIGRTPVRLIAMVCMLLVIAMPFYFIMDKDEAFAYVNIDINPSIELKIDDNLRVYAVTPLNEDANKIVKKLTHYKNEDVEKVIGMIMNRSEEAGLINQGKNMLVGVSFIEDESRATDLINRLRRHLTRDKASWEIVAFQVPKKIREKAKKKNKSMNETMATEIIDGKKNAVNKEEKAIIESFYHKTDNQKQQERPGNPDKKENENNEKISKTQPGKQDNIEQGTTKQKNEVNKQGQHKQKENNSENAEKKQHPNKKEISEKKNKNVKHGNHKHTYKTKKKKERHRKHIEKRESKHRQQNNKHNQNKHKEHDHGRSRH